MGHNFWEWLHSSFTLISLGATLPALTVCVMVLMAWHSQYIHYCHSKNRDMSLTLIAGVYIGFFGSMIDNVWWGVAWTGDYLQTPWRDWFFANGVYPNTFFRQGALIWAGCLHISAENMARNTPEKVNRARLKTKMVMALSVVGSLGFVGGLMLVKTLT